MSDETFSVRHEYVAGALAREFNEYFAHWSQLNAYFEQLDCRGNKPVYRDSDKAKTEEGRIKIIVLCSMYVEALANLYLSLKLDSKQFGAIERIEILEKWEFPSIFFPSYEIPRNQALYEDLKTLVAQRNAVVHMKPRILSGNKITHQGSGPKAMDLSVRVKRWVTLPIRLIDNLGNCDQSDEFLKFKVLSCVNHYKSILSQGENCLKRA